MLLLVPIRSSKIISSIRIRSKMPIMIMFTSENRARSVDVTAAGVSTAGRVGTVEPSIIAGVFSFFFLLHSKVKVGVVKVIAIVFVNNINCH